MPSDLLAQYLYFKMLRTMSFFMCAKFIVSYCTLFLFSNCNVFAFNYLIIVCKTMKKEEMFICQW